MKNKVFLIISTFLSGIYILFFGLLTKNKEDIGGGFGQASTKIEEDVCPIGVTNLLETKNRNLEKLAGDCQKKVFRSLKNKNNNVMFISNSQLGAINQRSKVDQSYVSIISDYIKKEKLPIFVTGLWIENINLLEIKYVYSSFVACGIKVDTLLIPAFLDDTRNAEIRTSIKKYKKFVCPELTEEKIDFKKNKFNKGNVSNVTNKLKANLAIFSYLQNLNDNFRGRLYLLRNTIFNIKPTTIRKISKVRLNQNLEALEDIINQRKLRFEKTIIYIPPLLYSEQSDLIPYEKEEYQNFKLKVSKLCQKKENCFYINLENAVPNKYWGFKKSISLRKDEISGLDFMHFNGEGHRFFSKVLKKILFEEQNY